MSFYRRLLPALAIFIIAASLLFTFQRPSVTKLKEKWREFPQKVGLGEWSSRFGVGPDPMELPQSPHPVFKPGTPKPPNSEYRKVLIVPKLRRENITWMDEAIPHIEKAIYVADDPDAPLHPPVNKGHEVMIYFTYIIDHYEDLPDVMIFMHAHRRSWHNNDLLHHDAGEMIKRLSSERVTREGFMNMRCHWFPGCPDWIHPGETKQDLEKAEQILIAKAWTQIFPFDPVPQVLAQPCCSQFALSKERVLSLPKSQYMFYRNWLLKTPLKDFISGRVWEYMWQFVFTGQNYWCPVEHVCYCDGFGVCLGGKDNYDAWITRRKERDRVNSQLLAWNKKQKAIQQALEEGREKDAEELPKPEPGQDKEFEAKIKEIQKDLDDRVNEGIRRGADPRNRAAEAGREWKQGDGF